MVVICFHEIGYKKQPWAITPGRFRQIITPYLSPDYIGPVPELHFDDARSGVWFYAARYLPPFIKQGKIIAVINPVVDWLDGINIPDNERYSGFMGWDQLEECRKRGFEIGCHSCSHKNMLTLDEAGLTREIVVAKAKLERQLEIRIDKFAYPYGAYDKRIMEAVMEHFRFAFALKPIGLGMKYADYEIPREVARYDY